MTQDKDEALSAALGWPGGISEPLLDRPALLRLVASASAELASMRRSFEAADRERGELRERAERAEAEIEELRGDLKAMKDFADLWYFVSDEAPLEFEKIVTEYSPGRWLTEARKLRAVCKAWGLTE